MIAGCGRHSTASAVAFYMCTCSAHAATLAWVPRPAGWEKAWVEQIVDRIMKGMLKTTEERATAVVRLWARQCHGPSLLHRIYAMRWHACMWTLHSHPQRGMQRPQALRHALSASLSLSPTD
jgi:hypothetical protein